ncbi:hypothetical protein FDP41_007875 [Naegleria fowleri]|uniref:Peptidase C1A papain C-terminal domain-containing protein n=1 Tax=Naegleria fowleri TaxID=5763 RepID=A0A6A5CEE5_NAEFO|nr:uncharacterized protein FDP41_007875 [Naegleria fowleri]KAF0983960.1 hypothetical protein FDP41_007875 [Naegleria fowleri]CAG4716960.1 unnamed protein product [Naegleria fowleri]
MFKRIFLLATTLLVVSAAIAVLAQDPIRQVNDPVLINLINNSPKVFWKATHYPQFENMSVEDFRKRLGAVLIQPGTADMIMERLQKQSSTNKVVAAPASFDSRVKWPKCIHPIRNQEQCGSCWAFSASEVLSDRLCIATDGKTDLVLSPQYMVSCDTRNYGCDGGYLNLAWNFLVTTGIPSDACVPYTSGDGKSNGKCPTKCSNGQAVTLYKAKSAKHVIGVSNAENELYEYGPIQTGFTVYRDFMSYKSGVYHHVSGEALGGHAVKIVGYGVDSVSNKKYWIVANSWGTSWGMNGFFWILKGVDECNIESGMWTGYA